MARASNVARIGVKFLLDESADFRIRAHLAGLGHDDKAVAVDFPASLTDREVPHLATSDERVLITNDPDFGELVVARGAQHAGVVLLRLGPYAPLSLKLARIDALLDHFPEHISGFVIVTPHRIRSRQTDG